jgi:hypothetical protein
VIIYSFNSDSLSTRIQKSCLFLKVHEVHVPPITPSLQEMLSKIEGPTKKYIEFNFQCNVMTNLYKKNKKKINIITDT